MQIAVPQRRILALDIGTTTGWAMSKGDHIFAWGIADFRVKCDDPTGGHRFTKFETWLGAFAGVEEVIIERVGAFQSSQQAIAVYYGMMAFIQKFCSNSGAELSGIHTSSLKKQFTGNGRADKMEMCGFAHRLGWTGGRVGTDQDHDACDAVALIVCKQMERGIEMRF